MKLVYVANIRLPTEKAHGIQIMEMCAAFSGQGAQVELIVPNRHSAITEDPFIYHDVKRTFQIRRLPCLDLVHLGRVGFFIESVSFALNVIVYALFKHAAVFITRDELPALALRVIGKRVLWEEHTGQRNLAVRLLIRLHTPIVVITEALKDLYTALGASSSRILVAPDGADLERFATTLSKEEARRQLGLPANTKIALYKGHLYERKGAHTLARAADDLRSLAVQCVFIGGTEEDVASFKKEFGSKENVMILGNRPRRETPVYQRAADLLVIPNSAKDDVSKLYTSPMKLFGYLASGVPIIASDLPSLREIVDESLVSFFTPDDPQNLAQAIRNALVSYPEAQKKATRAQELAGQYSWQRRAEHILRFARQGAAV